MRRQHAHLLAGHGNWQLATESASFLFDHVAVPRSRRCVEIA